MLLDAGRPVITIAGAEAEVVVIVGIVCVCDMMSREGTEAD